MGRKNILLLVVIVLAGFVTAPQTAVAVDESAYNNSGLPIPRFVSLRSDKVFVRSGPALRYPIKWVYTKDGLPVEIVQEFDTWRKIRDRDGEEGWIHQSLLSGTRTALVVGEEGAYLLRKPVTGEKRLVLLEPSVLVTVERCSGAWCGVTSAGYEGWIERKSLWGVYQDEELD